MQNKIISFVLIIFFFGLSVFSWLKPATEFSESERRALAKFPDASVTSILSGKFMKDFETYSTEQFPLRDTFRSIKAIVNKYILNQADNNGIFLKDGYIGKIEYPLNEESVSIAADKFKSVYDKYLSGSECKVYFAPVPDKNYYLIEDDYLSVDYDKMFSQIKAQTGFMKYIDIRDLLTLQSFYKTDTHWRQEEIIDVAKAISAEMGVEIKAEYDVKTLDNDFYGVYHGQSALPLPPEEIKYLTNDVLRNVRVYDYESQKEISVYDMEKAYGKDPYEMFLSGSISLLSMENESATTDKELIIFRDSFGSSLAPLFAEGYKKITVVDIRYIHPNMLGEFIEFINQDVLFLYSTSVLNNSETIK